MEPLTIESLARAIHADSQTACKLADMDDGDHFPDGTFEPVPDNFDALNPKWKRLRMEQARLMFLRIMR